MNWVDWYFERARVRPDQAARNLYWKEIGPGCSNRMLAQVAQVVLDMPDPTMVDWRFLRPGHLWLKHDQIDRRTLSAAMSNIKRIASKGAQRRVHPWFNNQMGWERAKASKSLNILTEEDYILVEEGATSGIATDLGLGVRTALRLMYYAGLQPGLLARLELDDILEVDGRMLLYSSGRLLEMPDHIRLVLAPWLRYIREAKLKGRKAKAAKVFRTDVIRIANQFKSLTETYFSLRRLRG